MLSRAQIKRLLKDSQKKLSPRQLQENLQQLHLWVQNDRDNPEALSAFSLHLLQAGQYSQAIDVLQHLLNLQPGAAAVRAQLIECLGKNGQHDAVLSEMEKLDINALADTKALEAVAIACGFADAYEKAGRVFKRLTELEPGNSRHWVNLGTMQHYCHQTSDARSSLRKAIKMDSRQLQSYWMLSQTAKASSEDNDIAELRKALSRKKLPLQDAITLQFSLGRQLEETGAYDEAFEYYNSANRLQYQQLQHTPQQDDDLFRLIQAQYQAKTDDGYAFGATPIFVCGLPRSGTSLVEQILGAHSQVSTCGEMHEFYRAMCLQAGSDGRPLPPATVMQREPAFRLEQLGKRYLKSTAHKRGDSDYFTDKMPGNSLYLGTIAKALPKAKIIVVERQPLDSIIGNFRMLYAGNMYPHSYNLDAMANYYEQHQQLMAFWRQQLGDRLYTVQYEDLVTAPEQEIEKLATACGLTFEATMTESHKHANAMGTASAGQVRQGIYQSANAAWRRFDKHIEPLIARFGSD